MKKETDTKLDTEPNIEIKSPKRKTISDFMFKLNSQNKYEKKEKISRPSISSENKRQQRFKMRPALED